MTLFLQLVDQKVIKILKTLISNPQEHFHIQKLSSQAKVPLSSTFRIVNKLVKLNLIKTIKVSKFKIYVINENKIPELKSLLKGGK
jgi:hypothetical protein